MGIPQLLKLLSPLIKPSHISEHAGQCIAIDAMCWLHRSAYCCALELIRSAYKGDIKHPNAYLSWLRHMVQLVLNHGVKPLFVFDGTALPLKSATLSSRRSRRAICIANGDKLYETGDMEGAKEAYQRAAFVSSEMVQRLQSLLRDMHVEFLVSPYEADAQIAYLYRTGRIQAAITEDSDLLAFGCEQVLLRMDRHGYCQQLNLLDVLQYEDPSESAQTSQSQQQPDATQRNIPSAEQSQQQGAQTTELGEEWLLGDPDDMIKPPSSTTNKRRRSKKPVKKSRLMQLKTLLLKDAEERKIVEKDEEDVCVVGQDGSSSTSSTLPSRPPSLFLLLCILSGCDYLNNLPEFGIARILDILEQARNQEAMFLSLKDRWKSKVKLRAKRAHSHHPPTKKQQQQNERELYSMATFNRYMVLFHRALLAFQHQIVYDVHAEQLLPLTALPSTLQHQYDLCELRQPKLETQDRHTVDDSEGKDAQHAIALDEDAEQVEDLNGQADDGSSCPATPTSSSSAAFTLPDSLLDPNAPAYRPRTLVQPIPAFQDLSFLGRSVDKELVQPLVKGRVCPHTLRQYTPLPPIQPDKAIFSSYNPAATSAPSISSHFAVKAHIRSEHTTTSQASSSSPSTARFASAFLRTLPVASNSNSNAELMELEALFAQEELAYGRQNEEQDREQAEEDEEEEEEIDLTANKSAPSRTTIASSAPNTPKRNAGVSSTSAPHTPIRYVGSTAVPVMSPNLSALLSPVRASPARASTVPSSATQLFTSLQHSFVPRKISAPSQPVQNPSAATAAAAHRNKRVHALLNDAGSNGTPSKKPQKNIMNYFTKK